MGNDTSAHHQASILILAVCRRQSYPALVRRNSTTSYQWIATAALAGNVVLTLNALFLPDLEDLRRAMQSRGEP
jgi:hypothetical protein